MKQLRRSILHSALALVLCISMLLGTTFAWFTDVVSSGSNVITSGNLEVEMYWTDDLSSGNWINAEGEDTPSIFGADNWEPGHTQVRYIKIVNAGSLSLRWRLNLVALGEVGALAEVIDVWFIDNVNANIETEKALSEHPSVGTLDEAVAEGGYTESGILLANGQTKADLATGETIVAIALQLQDDAGNAYQGADIGDGFSVHLTATQYTFESDSLGDGYDEDAIFPELDLGSVTVPVDGEIPAGGLSMKLPGGTEATLPEGVLLEDGAKKLTLSMKEVDGEANLTLEDTEQSKSYDVHIDGISPNNTVPIAVEVPGMLPIGLNIGNYGFYHVENGATVTMTALAAGDASVHNSFTYDSLTGDVVLYLASFSEVAAVADTENAWNGNFDDSWYDADAEELKIANADQLAAFGAIVGGMLNYTRDSFKGKTVTLISDINLGDAESENNASLIFYPIGYYNDTGSYEKVSGGSVSSTVYSFEGIFDGNGNTVKNFYQNTWEMFGDYNTGYAGTPNHYKDAMGLFGYVVGGTVKNLTVSNFSSDGEFTPTGVIAAYAKGDCTFENITLVNCHPATYNTGVAGIVGWDDGGDDQSDAEKTHYLFKNITVDDTNTISALWGSYDVAAAGLLGYLGRYSTAEMVNCHVSATLDVYNDVCGNYQYYWYRYCGMMIGTVDRTDASGAVDLTGITATNCTVSFGDRHEYYYCEFVKNSIASYTHDYQFSRVPHSEIDFDENGKALGCTHDHEAGGAETIGGKEVLREDKQAVYLPFRQLFGGYGWGVKGTDILAYTAIEISEKTTSVEKFEARVNGESYENGVTLTVGEIFGAKGNVVSNQVMVFVSPVGEESTVSAVYTADSFDWALGTLTFSGIGAAKIVITDYNYCLETVTSITIKERANVDKFAAKENLSFEHTLEGGVIEKTLGDIFSVIAGSEISTDGIRVTVTDGSGVTTNFKLKAEDWAASTLSFSGAGAVTITITDQSYCNEATATVDIKHPAYADKFESNAPLTHTPKTDKENYSFKVGELFALKDGITLQTAVVITVGADKHTVGANEWQEYEITLIEYGTVTVTITDNNYCNAASGTVIFYEPVTEAKFDYIGKEIYYGGTTVKLGELFALTSGAELGEGNAVLVTVDGEGYTLSEDESWAERMLTFTKTGSFTLTIKEDSAYCTATAKTLSVVNYDKFESKQDQPPFNHKIENDEIEATLGDIFSAIEGAEIDSATVELTVVGNGADCKFERNESDWTKSRLVFTGEGTVEITITDGNYCVAAVATVTVGNPVEAEVFDVKFENVDKYLYRVGNGNTVLLSSLFGAANLANGATVSIVIESVSGNVAGSYTANATDWKKGTIKFTGTGVAKITVDSNAFTVAKTLTVEVIDAKNYPSDDTASLSATANNVVLLNNISGTFTVSNGYTFYGNGFTVTLPTASVQNIGNGFTGYISIGASQDDGIANGGNLDNVRIEGPVYPEMYIYRDQAKITDTSDADYGDGYNMRYFRNSVIVYGGNVTISNCYISGSRTALCLRGGNNVTIENTTLSGGAYANMQICAGSKVTLRDLTTVQVDTPDSYGKGKTAHGLGIAVDSDVVDLYIEGELNQYNWLCQDQWNKIVPSTYQSSFPKFFTANTFSKYWHYLNGGTDPYVNMAFIYACNWDTARIHDNRTTVDYGTADATIAGVAGGVYSKVNTVGGNAIEGANIADPGYTSPGFNPIAPKLDFDNTANNDEDDASDATDSYCVYDDGSGTLKLALTSDSKTLDLSGVKIVKNGVVLSFAAYLNGTQISDMRSVTIKAADGTKQTLTLKATSDDAGYDKDGNPIAGSIEYIWTVTVEVATLAFPAPEWNMGGNYQFGKDDSDLLYAYYSTSNGYGEAVPIYEGIKVKYYDKNGKPVELDLSGTTTHPTGSDKSNSNAFTYTLADGSTLTMKFSSGWKSGATTHQFTTYKNKVYIYPQSLDNDNYIRAKTTNQDFDVKITYTFTDPNGQSTGTQTMRWYNAKAENGSVTTVQWKTFDSSNGKECVTGDTLITLVDGTQVRVDSLFGDELLLVWNMETGAFDSAPLMFIDSENEREYEVIHLRFSDGTEVKVIYEHGFWDYDLNRYVYLDRDASQYIGHTFAKQSGDALVKVTLDEVEIRTEVTTAWSPVTVGHLCYFVNGMLSMPGGVGGLFNFFEIDPETMSYDEEAMQRDIETYGLFTYEEMNAICPLSEDMFYAAGGAYLKVSIGKGNLTEEQLIEMITRYSIFLNLLTMKLEG